MTLFCLEYLHCSSDLHTLNVSRKTHFWMLSCSKHTPHMSYDFVKKKKKKVKNKQTNKNQKHTEKIEVDIK